MQIQAKIGDTVCNRGEKLGNNYLDLEAGNKFGNQVQVPGSGYNSVAISSGHTFTFTTVEPTGALAVK